MEEYKFTPLQGKRVVIVCDENTLQELLDARQHILAEGLPGDFIHVVEEITDVTITAEQMFHQERMSHIFAGPS